MANFVFNNSGVANRFNVATTRGANGTANTTNFNWTIPAGSAAQRFIVYNECDSTIVLDFQLQSGHNAGTNDNAGNVVEIYPNNRGLRIAPLSAAIVYVARDGTSTTNPSNAAITNAVNSARTSHGTASAVGGRQDDTGATLGERVLVQALITN